VLVGSVTLLALLAAGQVDVRSSTDCPSSSAIAAKLGPLLPTMAEHDLADVQLLGRQPDGTTDLHLALFDPAHALLGERRVLLRGSCEQVAEAVAAILAAWKSSPVTIVSPASPVPSAAQAAMTARQAASQPAPRQPPRFRVLVAAGASVHLVGGVALGGNLELRLGKAVSHWALRFAWFAQTARQSELPADPAPGQVDWRHTSAALGLAWHTLHPRWRLALDAGLVTGWATVTGRGFDTNRTARSFEYGATAGLRGGRSWGRFTLWVEARPTLWLKGHEVRVTGSPAGGSDLPVVDVAVTLGVSVSIL
jgi:hypothetical protein